MSRRAFVWPAISLPFAVALIVYGVEALRSPLLDGTLADRAHYLEAMARPAPADPVTESAAAEAYWRRYPDVARDAYYGRSSPLGVRGARLHYLDHGRREGRRWGP